MAQKQRVKPVRNLKMWCYYAPDGWPQVRTLSETKKQCREMIEKYDNWIHSWKQFEIKGYFIKRVDVSITERLKLSQR
jgi:hypothetical protein